MQAVAHLSQWPIRVSGPHGLVAHSGQWPVLVSGPFGSGVHWTTILKNPPYLQKVVRLNLKKVNALKNQAQLAVTDQHELQEKIQEKHTKPFMPVNTSLKINSFKLRIYIWLDVFITYIFRRILIFDLDFWKCLCLVLLSWDEFLSSN